MIIPSKEQLDTYTNLSFDCIDWGTGGRGLLLVFPFSLLEGESFPESFSPEIARNIESIDPDLHIDAAMQHHPVETVQSLVWRLSQAEKLHQQWSKARECVDGDFVTLHGQIEPPIRFGNLTFNTALEAAGYTLWPFRYGFITLEEFASDYIKDREMCLDLLSKCRYEFPIDPQPLSARVDREWAACVKAIGGHDSRDTGDVRKGAQATTPEEKSRKKKGVDYHNCDLRRLGSYGDR